MNWLLLLSALFSTLTGVSVGPRPQLTTVQQSVRSSVIRQSVIASAPQPRAHAHLLGTFGVRAVFTLTQALVAFSPASGVPLYLSRLRV